MGIHYEQYVTVYRFGSSVALHSENGSSVYLTPELAKKMSEALLECAQDVQEVPQFTNSTFESLRLLEGVK